jgi:hypothetical protein
VDEIDFERVIESPINAPSECFPNLLVDQRGPFLARVHHAHECLDAV